MQQLEGAEKTFYQDQQTTRKCRLNKEADEKYETEKELNRSKQAEEAELDELEYSFINDTSFDENITQYKRTCTMDTCCYGQARTCIRARPLLYDKNVSCSS